jgi:predicted esterase
VLVSDPLSDPLGFVHRFVHGRSDRVLLLLHGTGGDEENLLPLGRLLDPEATLLSPRGKVLERGMPRFFRRLAEGVFDEADLLARTDELARFIETAGQTYGLTGRSLHAVGFSNGANIAASLLLGYPGLLRSAVLFRAMVPFEPSKLPVLPGTPVRLGAGRQDPIVPRENTERLARLLGDAGARVTLDWRPAGHALAAGEVEAAREWLASIPG